MWNNRFRESLGSKCILCVDRPENVFDLADATKVLVVGEQPVRISKALKDYNAIDCGIFYCTPAIFNALSAAIAGGDTALTGAVQRLIQSDEMRVFDIHGRISNFKELLESGFAYPG